MTAPLRLRLDATALRLFTTRGISEVSTRDIAEAMGVQVSTLYRHMKSKEALVSRIFGAAYQQLAARLRADLAGAQDTRDELHRLVASACAAYDEDPDLIRFLLMRQHDVLRLIERPGETPLEVVMDICRRGCAARAIDPAYQPEQAAALLTGMILQPLIFTHYGSLAAPAGAQVPVLTHAIDACLLRRVQ